MDFHGQWPYLYVPTSLSCILLGLLTSKLSYKNGKNTPVNYIKFDNITLSLPQYGSGQTVSLKTLLGLYVCQV